MTGMWRKAGRILVNNVRNAVHLAACFNGPAAENGKFAFHDVATSRAESVLVPNELKKRLATFADV